MQSWEPNGIGVQAASSEAPAEHVAPSQRELRTMFRTFKDAKDRWKIDGSTMKGFYLHSESGYLYIWDQPTGVLREFSQTTGECQVVWSSVAPEINAELWTVLPLPPTDPAALLAAHADSAELPNIDTYLTLIIAHEAGRQVPADVLAGAADDFCERWQLQPQARQRLQTLSAAGQGYAIASFRGEGDSYELSKAFIQYIGELRRMSPPPWGKGACTLRVEATGAIIGRCCPDLDALCRDDPPARLAQAHCKIMSEKDRFFVSNMAATEEGTVLDGFCVDDTWVGPLKTGMLLTVGPLRIKFELSDMAKDTPLPGGRPAGKRSIDDDDDGHWQAKVYRKTGGEKQIALQRQSDYKDRAEERRVRSGEKAGSGNAAIDGLINKFHEIQKAEEAVAEFEDSRTEMPMQEAQREANMGTDGSFIGFGQGIERAGIGFASSQSAELIPDVLDPKGLSQQEMSRKKMQMRFSQSHTLPGSSK